MKKIWKGIYEVIDAKYLDELKVKFPKYFLTEFESEFDAPLFITLGIKKGIQQVGLEYGLFSQMMKIKR